MFISRKKYNEIIGIIKSLENRITELETSGFSEWKAKSEANKDTAAKEGYFYLTSEADTILLEKLIQEVNKDPDLAVMLRTADGATLTLRSYPVLNNKISSAMNMFARGENK